MNISIYQIQNKVNGKIYIGQTQNIKRRWLQHRREKKRCPALIRALDKYGLDNFEFTVLVEGLSQEHANNLEGLFIQINNTLAPNGYNIASGGHYGNPFAGWTEERLAEHKRLRSRIQTGKKPSAETLRRMSEVQKGRKHSEESKRKMSEVQKGRKFTDEHRRNLTQALRGRKMPPRTEENRRKISEIHKGRKRPPEAHVKAWETRRRNHPQLDLFPYRKETNDKNHS